jgi:hypothetical protein
MADTAPPPMPIRFGEFEIDLAAGDLRRRGVKLRLRDNASRFWQSCWNIPGKSSPARTCAGEVRG